MPNIVKVDTNDKLRALLTDVLPYELPLWFSNYTLYQRFSTPDHTSIYEAMSGLNFQSEAGVYIPLDYLVSRGGHKSPRTISIMHPVAQLKVCDFYDKYDDLIEYYCTKSKYSLRHPYRKSTKFYGKAQAGSKAEDGVEGIDEERIVSSSYFKYRKFPFLYRFFESYEYHKLEKQFHSMLQVDVSKCFPSIYTHSIGWAVKSKRLAKSKPRAHGDFDGKFDNLMQLTNYRETNGIIIGPEVSRVFAEIILQKIDLNLVEKVSKKGYFISKDYDFRRYVDDYFVFFRSDDVKLAFIKALESSLLEYKMYLNDAKTTIASRPFATDISLAKHELNHAVGAYYRSRYKEKDDNSYSIIQLKSPSTRANKAISEIKMALANHKVEYNSISNYLFSAIMKRMLSYMSKVAEVEEKEEFHLNWLLVDLDVIFFVHAMDIRIRPTDRLARLIHDLLGKISSWPRNHREIIFKKIFDHVKQAINIFINHANDMIGLETLNLLIILTMLPQAYQIPENKLKEYLGRLNEHSETNDFYFLWVTFMLYIEKKPEYQKLREELIKTAENYLLVNEDMFISAEYFMFYFDFLACPHIDDVIRKNLITEVKSITLNQKLNPVQFNVNNSSKIVLNKDFIVSWRDPEYLKNSLEKKEYIFSYN
ncbi:antiviral reverse transcriptase Drt3b [Pseudoalteromonas peptidolytica]|uniref:antiviral reverse transcriptase Drt3b n=1 Tax=Pseudoalteromonas peptidolytica TaxID=61150 RepID=UPI00298DE08F|nr:antiviral reverse transcriptase Drt3b [Pseudoalteromonas peptidolytica]MDW7549820.1 antiviral reverse transcriptase Drt3b [Pseudoalteromonas peptidolytica]